MKPFNIPPTPSGTIEVVGREVDSHFASITNPRLRWLVQRSADSLVVLTTTIQKLRFCLTAYPDMAKEKDIDVSNIEKLLADIWVIDVERFRRPPVGKVLSALHPIRELHKTNLIWMATVCDLLQEHGIPHVTDLGSVFTTHGVIEAINSDMTSIILKWGRRSRPKTPHVIEYLTGHEDRVERDYKRLKHFNFTYHQLKIDEPVERLLSILDFKRVK